MRRIALLAGATGLVGRELLPLLLDDGDIESFFDLTLNVDINFRPQFYEKIVVVPRGGGTSGVELKVVAK